jgi:hypothetical protein
MEFLGGEVLLDMLSGKVGVRSEGSFAGGGVGAGGDNIVVAV